VSGDSFALRSCRTSTARALVVHRRLRLTKSACCDSFACEAVAHLRPVPRSRSDAVVFWLRRVNHCAPICTTPLQSAAVSAMALQCSQLLVTQLGILELSYLQCVQRMGLQCSPLPAMRQPRLEHVHWAVHATSAESARILSVHSDGVFVAVFSVMYLQCSPLPATRQPRLVTRPLRRARTHYLGMPREYCQLHFRPLYSR
jgi:hypothetical protein